MIVVAALRAVPVVKHARVVAGHAVTSRTVVVVAAIQHRVAGAARAPDVIVMIVVAAGPASPGVVSVATLSGQGRIVTGKVARVRSVPISVRNG